MILKRIANNNLRIGIKMTEIEKKAKEFTEYLYEAYGSGTGVLFGIPSDCRDAVYTIIKLTIEKVSKEHGGE